MAKREQIEAALDGLPDSELDPVLQFIVSRGESGTVDEIVDIPVGLRTFADGTAQPDWETALRRSRASH